MKIGQTSVFMASVLAVIGILPATFLPADSQSQIKNEWAFKTQPGQVKIALLEDPSRPEVASLQIEYEGDAHPSLTDEVGFLREVLRALPPLGVDPRNVAAISMRGFAEPEVRKRVAIAALHSKEWKSYTTLRGGAERVVKDLLISLGAYDAFNGAFEEYGAKVKLSAVEKVASERCLDLELTDPDCNSRYNPRVPIGANIQFEIERGGQGSGRTQNTP